MPRSEQVRIVFTRNWLPGSLMIRAATWSRWSHVGIIDGEYVIESAVFVGVRRRPLVELIRESSAHAFSALPAKDARLVIEAARSQVGKPFDYMGIVGLAFRGNWQRRRSWFCSELAAWSSQAGGKPWFRRDRIGRVTPEHLWMLAPTDSL